MSDKPFVRINIIGQAGSGKSELAKHLQDTYGFEIYRPSDVIREYARNKGITLAARQDYFDLHKAIHNEDPLAIVNPVIASNAARLLIDGMRAPQYTQHLKQKIGMLTLALDCPPEVRYSRVIGAAAEREGRDSSNIKSFAEFIADEKADNVAIEPWLPNVPSVMQAADISIDASQPLDVVRAETAKYLEQLGIVS